MAHNLGVSRMYASLFGVKKYITKLTVIPTVNLRLMIYFMIYGKIKENMNKLCGTVVSIFYCGTLLILH